MREIRQQIEAMAAAFATPEAPIPRDLVKTALQLILGSVDLARSFSFDSETGNAWGELNNKLQAYCLFEHVDSILGIAYDKRLSLTEMIVRASALDPYFSVWATEGVGHYFTDLHLQKQILPENLLTEAGQGLASARMVPLHSGMALSLAEFSLGRLNSGGNCAHAVNCFIEACQHNCKAGYFGIGYEGLGFVTRILHPRLLGPIDSHLSRFWPEVLTYFWHGVGRAIYFSPLNFMPCEGSSLAGLEMAMRDAPHLLAKRNVIAGFAWASTLINIRHPKIIATLLQNCREMPELDAFVNGVQSALVAWCGSTPEHDFLDTFCQYRPQTSDQYFLQFWDSHVVKPGEEVLKEYRSMEAAKRVGDLFHC